MSKKKSLPQTRRKFIKGTVAGMAVGWGASAFGSGPRESKAEIPGVNWSLEADVVVVGSGVGGCVAAIAAHDAGAKVFILEKASSLFFGGNSSVSGGNFYAASPDKFYKELMHMSADRADQTTAKTLAENAETSIKWLDGTGVRLVWTQRKDYAVAPERGKGAVKDLLKILQHKGIEVLFEKKAKRLLQDTDHRVVGVQVASKSGMMNVKAGKAVILATGGYLGNEEMTVRYMGPQATGIIDLGFRHITGDGHRMALELGTDLINMGDCRLAPMLPKSKGSFGNWYPHGIIVNKESQRFVNEAKAASGGSSLGKVMFGQTDGIGYVILDEKWKTLVPTASQERFLKAGNVLSEADSIEDLAKILGLDPISLRQTVNEFNAAVKDGMALGVHPPKTGEAVKLDTPKFYGIPLVNGSTLSFGGVRINKKAQIINLEGEAIPGVYAAGILVGGLYYQNYKSGFGLASAVTFGRLAGTYAAQEKPLSE